MSTSPSAKDRATLPSEPRKHVAGVLFASALASLAVSSAAALRQAAMTGRATGSVVSLDDNGDCATPIVTFEDAHGVNHAFRGNVCASPAGWEAGERATVAYDPRAPGRADLDTFGERWLLPTVFGGVAVVMLGAGVLFWNLRGSASSEDADG